ncbi:MAG: alpha/beta hydrolase [Nocardioidaceae bacterium]
MPFGYLVTVLLAALCTLVALRPPRPRRSGPFRLSYWLGYLVNELPFLVIYWLLASTALAFAQGDVDGPVGWFAVGLAAATVAVVPVLVWRALRAREAVEAALAAGLGPGWRAGIDEELAARLRRRLPWARILLTPWWVRRRDVERLPNLSYGPAGRRNHLDVYRHRSQPSDGPMLVYVHGGAFRSGRKNREARPLLYRLASQGWVCISANYRLSPAARFPDHLVDLKRVIAWAREHSPDYGGDPHTMFVAGSSAGGHLATMAALTPGDPRFQPGFEAADTTVTGVISLYGYYGGLGGDRTVASSPADYVHADAPPFFAAHGDQDTLVIVEDVRRFVDELRPASAQPVVYAELPGAQHGFDVFHSIRFDTVVDGVEAFTAWVRSQTRPSQG